MAVAPTRIGVALGGIAALAVVGAVLSRPTGREPPRHGVIVVARAAPSPLPAPRPANQPALASIATATPGAADVADTDPAGVPANYAYWENDSAGVWGTPAEFSPEDR